MRTDFCGNCEFFADKQCRKSPPVPVAYQSNDQLQSFFTYPKVSKDNPCCSEFKPHRINAAVTPRRRVTVIKTQAKNLSPR